MRYYLDFEKPVADLEAKIDELRQIAESGGPDSPDIADEVAQLTVKAEEQLRATYAKLTAWQKAQVARHPDRPKAGEYVAGLITEFTPLAGDRAFADDAAVIGGLGRFRGRAVVVLGTEKGHDTDSRVAHNFGMARPEGYRKARRLIELAGRFGLPVADVRHRGRGCERGRAGRVDRELADATLRRDFRRIQPAQARVLLYEGGPGLLAGFADKLSRYAQARLERLGVEVHTGSSVETIDAAGVMVGGQRIESANVFWCAGVAATPAAGWLGVTAGKHGAVPVEPDCSVSGTPEVFVIGDIASLAGKDGKLLPGVAPVAEQQGRYVGDVIAARVGGTAAPGPFRYRDQGSLAVIGRSAAVADLPYAELTGFVAWVMWGGVHLFLLNGLRNRILVYVQWAWAWLTYSRGARLIEGDPPQEKLAG